MSSAPEDTVWERYGELRSAEMTGLMDALGAGFGSVSRLLWERSDHVGSSSTAPSENLEALSSAGLYGVFAPERSGGMGLGYDQVCELAEEMAGSCATTTFLWVQHLRLLGTMLSPSTPAALVERYKADVVSGTAKGGVVLTGLMPGRPRLLARPNAGTRAGTWSLDGEAPWFSGWKVADLIVVVARTTAGGAASFLVTQAELSQAAAVPTELSALRGTCTVRVLFRDLAVHAGALIGEEPPEALVEDPVRLRLNGAFPLGLARRCCAMAGPSALDAELADVRVRLREAKTAEQVAGARAAASELAVRAAHLLAVSRGSRSASVGDPAERLSREAAMFLVFGTRPAIRQALLDQLTPSKHAGPSAG